MKQTKKIQGMFGWRARIGAVGPAVGYYAKQFYKLAPEGVDLVFTGTPLTEDTVEQLIHLGDYVADAAKLIAPLRLDVIVSLSTTGSLMKGVGYDQELIKKIEDATNIPATTSSTAMLVGLRKLGIKRVSVACAYIDEVNEYVKKFLEGNGFEVPRIDGHQRLDVCDITNTTPYETYRLAKSVDMPEADGIYISCAGLDTLDIIEPLERDLGKPVLTSIQSSFWHGFRMAGVTEPIHGYGRLMLEQL
jgi:maleate isomerase